MYSNIPVKEPSEKATSEAGTEKDKDKSPNQPLNSKAEELEKLRKRRMKMAKTAKGGDTAFNFFFGKEK